MVSSAFAAKEAPRDLPLLDVSNDPALVRQLLRITRWPVFTTLTEVIRDAD